MHEREVVDCGRPVFVFRALTDTREAHICEIKDEGPQTLTEWTRAIIGWSVEVLVVLGICALLGLAVAFLSVGFQR